ncbi:hypothetical protein N9I56_07000 [Alphaproteobacteria bacterium]|nr:hypothetical protein [Alphaproteobacteria bacterium]
MTDWGHMTNSIFVMLGMCFGGYLFGQLARFGYERFNGKDEGSYLFLVLAPASAGLGVGMHLLALEFSSVGAADWVFWVFSVPSSLLMLWAIPTCFVMFIVMPALGGLGLLLQLAQSASAKVKTGLSNHVNWISKFTQILFFPVLLIRDFLRSSRTPLNHKAPLEQNSSHGSAYIWIVLILIAIMGFKVLGSAVMDVKQQVKMIKKSK